MSDREEWGPWVPHDGKGCPCVGKLVQCEWERYPGSFRVDNDAALARGGKGWFWQFWLKPIVGDSGDIGLCARITRYRIKRPRALQQLREMIETLPAPSRQKEDA